MSAPSVHLDNIALDHEVRSRPGTVLLVTIAPQGLRPQHSTPLSQVTTQRKVPQARRPAQRLPTALTPPMTHAMSARLDSIALMRACQTPTSIVQRVIIAEQVPVLRQPAQEAPTTMSTTVCWNLNACNAGLATTVPPLVSSNRLVSAKQNTFAPRALVMQPRQHLWL